MQDKPDQLSAFGWYPVIDVTLPCDPLTETYGKVEYTFLAAFYLPVMHSILLIQHDYMPGAIPQVINEARRFLKFK